MGEEEQKPKIEGKKKTTWRPRNAGGRSKPKALINFSGTQG